MVMERVQLCRSFASQQHHSSLSVPTNTSATSRSRFTLSNPNGVVPRPHDWFPFPSASSILLLPFRQVSSLSASYKRSPHFYLSNTFFFFIARLSPLSCRPPEEITLGHGSAFSNGVFRTPTVRATRRPRP